MTDFDLPTVCLDAELLSLGPAATATDFEHWVAFVAERLPSEVGFAVNVHGTPGRSVRRHECIRNATGEQQSAIRDAMETMFDAWCEGAV